MPPRIRPLSHIRSILLTLSCVMDNLEKIVAAGRIIHIYEDLIELLQISGQ